MRKYRQDRRDREDESRGMKRYERERRERSSGYQRVAGEEGMMREDRSAMANLPQEKVMRYYPSWKFLNGAYLDDGIGGIDELNDKSVRKASRSMRRDAE